VKLLKNVRKGEVDNFLKETALCLRLRFPHLVCYLGACVEPRLCIVSEYLEGGTLYDLIHKRKLRDFDTLLRVGD